MVGIEVFVFDFIWVWGGGHSAMPFSVKIV